MKDLTNIVKKIEDLKAQRKHLWALDEGGLAAQVTGEILDLEAIIKECGQYQQA